MSLDSTDRAIRIFRKHGGILRTKQALAFGIHPRTLYAMRDPEGLDPDARRETGDARDLASLHSIRFG